MRTSFLLVPALFSTLLACSSDDAKAGSDDSTIPCVKVHYSVTADAGATNPDTCPDFPSVCAATDDPCHGDNAACNTAVESMCATGTKMHGCFASSLNDRLASLEILCEHQASDD